MVSPTPYARKSTKRLVIVTTGRNQRHGVGTHNYFNSLTIEIFNSSNQNPKTRSVLGFPESVVAPYLAGLMVTNCVQLPRRNITVNALALSALDSTESNSFTLDTSCPASWTMTSPSRRPARAAASVAASTPGLQTQFPSSASVRSVTTRPRLCAEGAFIRSSLPIGIAR